MAYGLKRKDLQSMAEIKLHDAVLLLNNGRWSSAYYLGGYALEFALKACIARKFAKDSIPDKDFLKDVFQHDLTNLVRVAGLDQARRVVAKEDASFNTFWGIAKEWSEQSRYEVKQQIDAQYLLEAIANPDHGVMQWVKKHW